MSATLQLGNHGIGAACLFVGASEKKQKRSSNKDGNDKQHRHADLERAFQRERIARHFLRDSKRLESRLRHFPAFVGNARLLSHRIESMLLAQLNTNTRE